MAQIMAGDLRKGVTFLYDNKIMTIVDFCTSNRARALLSSAQK